MKFISDNLMIPMLAIVLVLSPLQSIVASVSNCMSMNNTMHHEMNMSVGETQHDMAGMAKSNVEDDCCNQNACDMTHCASASSAAIFSTNSNDVKYIVSNLYLKPNTLLIEFYPSSLYRPPKA